MSEAQSCDIHTPDLPIMLASVPLRTSDALDAIASRSAHAIARIWKFPHSVFLSAPSHRMHLAAYCLALFPDERGYAEKALTARKWRDSVPPAIITRCPEGTFRRMLLPLWPAASYQLLHRLLQHDRSKRTLNFINVPTPNILRMIDALPPRYRTTHMLSLVCSIREAELFASIVTKLESVSSNSTTNLHKSLGSVKSASAMWKVLARQYDGCIVGFPELGIDLPNGYQHIDTVVELQRVAGKFRNCLYDIYLEEAVSGVMAFVVKTGKPEVVIGLQPLCGGRYAIKTMSGMHNSEIVDKIREAIEVDLYPAGIFADDFEKRNPEFATSQHLDSLGHCGKNDPHRKKSYIEDAIATLAGADQPIVKATACAVS